MRSAEGAVLIPGRVDNSLAEYDYVIIPGGDGIKNLMQDKEFLRWITVPPGTAIQMRAEKKVVRFRTKGGDVMRDFLMLAFAHTDGLGEEGQQRVLKGTQPGPLGDAQRAVKEMGGFLRFAPLPGGNLETRLFLPL